jgi:hypothetical protein
MTDLTAVIHDLIAVVDRLGLPVAIMGGIAARQGAPLSRRPLGVESKLDEVLGSRD